MFTAGTELITLMIQLVDFGFLINAIVKLSRLLLLQQFFALRFKQTCKVLEFIIVCTGVMTVKFLA